MSSLILGGYDLLDLTSTVVLEPDSDLGSPQALTATAERLLTDGEVVSGERSGNRLLTLPLLIRGSRSMTAAALASLAATIDQQTYTVTWQPGGGLPAAFDCFRGQLTRVYDLRMEAQQITRVVATIPALPFTRNPGPVVLTPTAPATVQVDAMDNLTGLTVVGATSTADTATKIEGTGSVKTPIAISGGGFDADHNALTSTTTVTWARTVSSKNLSASTTAGFWVTADWVWSVAWTLRLAGSGWTADYRRSTSTGLGWTLLGFDLTAPTATSGTVNLAAVTSWQLTFSTTAAGAFSRTLNLWLDDLEGYPAGAGLFTGPVGTARYDGVLGSARTPVSLALVMSPGGSSAQAAIGLLVARYPDPPPGFNPILTSAVGGVVDADAFSGKAKGSLTVTVPAYSLSGNYAVVVRAKTTSGVTFTAAAKITGDTVYSQSVSRLYTSTEVSGMGGGTTGFNMFPIGVLTLPPRGVDQSNTTATVDITVSVPSGNPIDQAYLVDMAGDYQFIDPPASASIYYKAIFLDAPDAASPSGRVLGSTSTSTVGTRTDAVSLLPWLKGQPVMNFSPGSNMILVVAQPIIAVGSASWPVPNVTASYYPRWHAERSA